MNVELVFITMMCIASIAFGFGLGTAFFKKKMDILDDEQYDEVGDSLMVRYIEEDNQYEVISVYAKERIAMALLLSPTKMNLLADLINEKTGGQA